MSISNFTGWKRIKCQPATNAGYDVWAYLDNGVKQFFNVTKAGAGEPTTIAGYYHLPSLLRLKGIKADDTENFEEV